MSEHMQDARIVEEFTLPSLGKIYDGDSVVEVNPQIILSSMKARHEMLRLSSTDESHKIMAEIIDDCLESDLGMSSYDLCLGDFQYLLFKLRIVTFGPDYTIVSRCPLCGFEQENHINLDEYESRYYTEDYDDLKIITLPVTGHTVRLTYQTPRILDRVNVKIKEYRRRHGGVGEEVDLNPTILFNIMSAIEDIDDEIPTMVELEDWIMDLPLADANALINRIDELNNTIGIDLYTKDYCKICGTEYNIPFRINGTFFRPND